MTEEEKKRYWALYYATVYGWQLHPKNTEQLWNETDCARVADSMLKQMEARWPTGQQ